MHRHDRHGISENPDDNRGHAVQHIRRVAHDKGHRLAAKLSQVDSAQQPDGDAEQRAQQQKLAGPDDRVGHASAGFADGRGQLGEEIPVHILAAVIDEVAQDEE